MNINTIHLGGNLTRDPEVRYSQGGTAFCSFSIAVNHSFKRGEDWIEKTLFMRCVVFKEAATRFESQFKKGQACYVEGRFELNEWEDKQGNKKQTPQVVVRTFQNMEPRRSKQGGQPP